MRRKYLKKRLERSKSRISGCLRVEAKGHSSRMHTTTIQCSSRLMNDQSCRENRRKGSKWIESCRFLRNRRRVRCYICSHTSLYNTVRTLSSRRTKKAHDSSSCDQVFIAFVSCSSFNNLRFLGPPHSSLESGLAHLQSLRSQVSTR